MTRSCSNCKHFQLLTQAEISQLDTPGANGFCGAFMDSANGAEVVPGCRGFANKEERAQ